MKKTELKKILASSLAEFYSTPGNYGIFRGTLAISYPSPFSKSETLLKIDCQANDTRHADHKNSKESTRSFRHFPGLSGWYACSIETKHNFDLYGSGYESPERAEAFIALIRAEIEKRNLGYVYPDCPMSQIIAAYESLGGKLQLVEINQQPLQAWRASRNGDAA